MIAAEDYPAVLARCLSGDMPVAELRRHLSDDMFAIYFLEALKHREAAE